MPDLYIWDMLTLNILCDSMNPTFFLNRVH